MPFADGRNQRCRNDWSEARNLHQAMASIVLLGNAFKLVPLMLQLTNQV